MEQRQRLLSGLFCIRTVPVFDIEIAGGCQNWNSENGTENEKTEFATLVALLISNSLS